MSIHLQKEIEKLKQSLFSLGEMVEQALRKSISTIEERDSKLAQKLILGDLEIDRKEVEVEEDCLKILALYQPVAIDLRFIVAVLKINNDLERIGDLAVNIAERAIYLSKHERVDINFDYHSMSQLTLKMLKNCLLSLVNMETSVAHEIMATDNSVDEMHRQMFAKVEEATKQHSNQIDCILNYLSISRYLERIADLATNIAEDIIYMVEGEIIRHKMGENLNK